MSKHQEPPWGFWIPVKDRASAIYAARMAGFPVFLLGLSALATALGALIGQTWLLAAVMSALGLFFIISGLRIRAEKFGTFPITVSLWLLQMLIGIIGSLSMSGDSIQITILISQAVINLLIGLMVLCGVRGWMWLRQNPAEAE